MCRRFLKGCCVPALVKHCGAYYIYYHVQAVRVCDSFDAICRASGAQWPWQSAEERILSFIWAACTDMCAATAAALHYMYAELAQVLRLF
jgi:hypothetical protein